MNFIKTHLFYVVIIAVGLLAFHSWLAEHDAKLQADAVVKQTQQQLQDLKAQVVTIQTAAAAAKKQIVSEVTKVRTTPEAIAAIPDLSVASLNPRPSPLGPEDVTVAALPLVAELGQCKQDRIDLGACQAVNANLTQQLGAQDVEIKALKKKKGFWGNLKSTAKAVGIGVGIGLFLGHGGL